MSENGHAILTQSLTKRFGRKVALNEVNAHVPTGSIYGLLGPNGAGKTTFVRVLLNLLNPTRGSAMVLGHDVVKESVAVRRRVGHVAAMQPLWEWMRLSLSRPGTDQVLVLKRVSEAENRTRPWELMLLDGRGRLSPTKAPRSPRLDVLGFDDQGRLIVIEGARVEAVDLDSGKVTPLYP